MGCSVSKADNEKVLANAVDSEATDKQVVESTEHHDEKKEEATAESPKEQAKYPGGEESAIEKDATAQGEDEAEAANEEEADPALKEVVTEAIGTNAGEEVAAGDNENASE